MQTYTVKYDVRFSYQSISDIERTSIFSCNGVQKKKKHSHSKTFFKDFDNCSKALLIEIKRKKKKLSPGVVSEVAWLAVARK